MPVVRKARLDRNGATIRCAFCNSGLARRLDSARVSLGAGWKLAHDNPWPCEAFVMTTYAKRQLRMGRPSANRRRVRSEYIDNSEDAFHPGVMRSNYQLPIMVRCPFSQCTGWNEFNATSLGLT